MASTPTAKRRKYRRRTDEERIQELEARIAELREKKAAQRKKEDPVLKEIPKVQRRLRKFAQFAMDHGRPDIANSITAFNAGLERTLTDEKQRNRAAALKESQDDDGVVADDRD